jgi:serine/threonine protein kinase, bacterial
MGVVWRGQDLETGAWVAVKLLRPDYAGSPAAVARFVGERNALVRFRHPNVVNLRDMIVEGDRLALVMDLITGGDLDTFRQHNGGMLSPGVAVRVTAQVCDGLAAAHAAGIIHRDLKPSNVLLQAGQVKLADFGISRIAGEARRTTTGTVMGTPTYLAPEVINGADPTSACDMYAVGITLYELLAGEPPFDGHVVAVMQAHLQREATRIPGISDPLWELIAGCLSKDPAGRPTASDLARSLKALAEDPAAGALGPGPVRSVLPPPATRSVPQLSQQTAAEPTGRVVQSTDPARAGYGPPPGQVPNQIPAQSPAPALSPSPAQAGSPPPPSPGSPGPLAMPPASGPRRKHVLAGLAALAAAIAVAATVYLTGFAGSSTATLTRGGLTKPTIGSVTTIAPPTPGRPGRRPVHTGGKPGTPTPATSSPGPSHPASHPHGKPTAPASKHPSSPPVSPSTSPAPSATTPSVPFGVYQCGKGTTISSTNAAVSVMVLTACIRVYNGKVEIEGQLTGAVAGHDKIELALESANGTLGDYNSPLCSTSTCVYQQPVLTPSGHWYAVATVLGDGGPFTGAPSPTVTYVG